jgi:hypothetical protein
VANLDEIVTRNPHANDPAETLEGEIVLPHTPWDRMPGESENSYVHFLTYRDLGQDRTIAKAADRAHKSRDHFHRIATQWQWINRAGAWDVEQHRLFSAKAADQRTEMIERHARLGRSIMSIVEARLLTIPIDALTPLELSRLAEVASKLERSSWAEETSMRRRAGGASTVDGVDLTHLDEAARVARMEALRGELDRRIKARRALSSATQDGDAVAAA